MAQRRLRGPAAEDDELVDECIHTGQGHFVLGEELIDGVGFDRDLDSACVQLLDGNRVGAVVLYLYTQLGAFDSQRRIFGDQHRTVAVVAQVQTGGQNPVIGRKRIEDRRQPRRLGAVQFDAQRATRRQDRRVPQAARL